MRSFSGYKSVTLDSGEELIVDCSDYAIGGCNPVKSIRKHMGGCPVFEADYFESEMTEHIGANMSICRRDGNRLYRVPLHKAHEEGFNEDFFAGTIVKADDYNPRESAVELYYNVYKQLYDQAGLQTLDAGDWLLNYWEARKVLPEIEEDLKNRGLLDVAQFHAAMEMFPGFKKRMQETRNL